MLQQPIYTLRSRRESDVSLVKVLLVDLFLCVLVCMKAVFLL